ncbi:hypothetical protein Salat_1717500 [Sesamum alatum]|uniref:Uncharacterized protein n=1 Tax=Sesamum alatum TaxID=300844 RepID=A0AAE1Y8N6_9LAMI|nr:hypothetical protein Salat_1717500 [Sesamum alatum]
MAAYGFYCRQKLFYCEHWSSKIECTFVESLLEHRRKGSFHHDRTNDHAVLCSLFDINAKFGCQLSDCGSDDNLEHEEDFFDPNGTCTDDGWVHESHHLFKNLRSMNHTAIWIATVATIHRGGHLSKNVMLLTLISTV